MTEQGRAESTVSESHQAHAQQCWCLNDSDECCRPSCACHQRAVDGVTAQARRYAEAIEWLLTEMPVDWEDIAHGEGRDEVVAAVTAALEEIERGWAGDDMKGPTPPLYLRAWPKPRKRAPLAILCRPAFWAMRRDRRFPMRWHFAIERYAAKVPHPTFEELMAGDY